MVTMVVLQFTPKLSGIKQSFYSVKKSYVQEFRKVSPEQFLRGVSLVVTIICAWGCSHLKPGVAGYSRWCTYSAGINAICQ